MPIDLERALGAELPETTYSWSDDDVILYHLGIGAGDPPTDPGELRYAYEAELHVLPSYATIPPFGALMIGVANADGVDITLDKVLHGEQETILHRSIPTSGSVRNRGRIVDIYDKGKAAVLIVEVVSELESTGEPVFTNRSAVFVRGEGGFGGQPGPVPTDERPSRAPDHVVRSKTLPQQALLYRLSSGDKNPLHADPGFAVFAGFDRPILHGLCSYGIVAKAVVDTALDGAPDSVASYSARFAGVVYPGETIVTSIWDEGERLVVAADCAERETPVISNAAVVRSDR